LSPDDVPPLPQENRGIRNAMSALRRRQRESVGTDQVFRSVDEVPAGLRTRLLKSTNGANSATILIADRRGRQEIAKAMRHLPGPAQRRWMQTLMATEAAATAIEWLTPARRRAILVVVALLTVAALVLVFTRTG
jgi:hypothetical protein